MTRRAQLFVQLLLFVLSCIVGCGGTGPYTDIHDMPPGPATGGGGDLVIADGDNLNVRVFNQDPLSAQQRVRSDGKISIPVIGEVVARGKRPAQLATEIEERLKAVVKAPSVSVTLDAGAELKVSVVGEVKNSGTFQLEHGAGVLHALAAAGGLSEYADGDKVFVVRKGLPSRIRFRYTELRSADTRSIQFSLHGGDIVVVE